MSVDTHLDVTEDSFEQEVVERSRQTPVIVDFWAAWCGPCHALTPVLDAEVARRDGSVVLAKVDVDANQGLSAMFRVQGIPAVKGFRDGRVVAEFVGAQPPARVAAFVDELLAPPRIEGALDDLRDERRPAGRARSAGGRRRRARALQLLVDEIADAPSDERVRRRDLAVAIFDHLGQDDPVSVAYRRRLATALY